MMTVANRNPNPDPNPDSMRET